MTLLSQQQIEDAMMKALNPTPPQPQPQQRLSAFACLRFSDGSYYMHTYSIILGRNLDLARRDMVRLKQAAALSARGDDEGAEAIIQGRKRRRTDHRPRSVISEAGGIVSAPMSAMPMDYQLDRQSVSGTTGSSSSQRPQEDPIDLAPQDVIMRAFGEVPDQLENLVPEDPNDCPLVPIHPQQIAAGRGLFGPKGISREHAKIAYNFETGAFDLTVLSNNGMFHEGVFLQANDTVELNHGDSLSIGLVQMTFLLPDVALTEEQRARGSASRPMSFSFENGNGEVDTSDWDHDNSASDGISVDPRHVFHMPVSQYDSEEDAADEEDEEVDEDMYSSPEPKRRKEHAKLTKSQRKQKQKEKERETKRMKQKQKQQQQQQKLILKFKTSETNSSREQEEMPPPRKDAKNINKRKALREESPEEPAPKKVKAQTNEETIVASKDKGKARAKTPPAEPLPAKTPAKTPTKPVAKPVVKPATKAPAKEVPEVEEEKKPEPPDTPKAESPALARIPTEEGRESAEDVEQDGTITSDMIRRHNLPEVLLGYRLEKRKGPGRPPKDGVMSKRQRAQLVKQGKEIEKARAAGIDPADLPMPTAKPKAARPRKDSNANPAEGDEDDIRETTEKGDGTVLVGDKKQAKPNKPPRTPSPEMKESDYTEEQLQRPSANYVVLIHEAISSSKTGFMNLQQIYNYIERKYPFYKFKTTTAGWQSSVRHNLGQHEAFKKGEKEGKGYNWTIDPNVSIEKERRKRQVSPQVSHPPRPGYYPPPNGYPPYPHPGAYYHGMPGQGPPNGVVPPPNVEAVKPRLPPSLTRNASAATPTSQGAPNPSPYASPWAGGNTATAQNPPRPFPQPSVQPSHVGSGSAPSGQYGVLYPTTAPPSVYGGYSTSGPFGSQQNGSTNPYSNALNRPYTPYASTGAQQNPSQPPHSSNPTSHPPQPRPPQSESPAPHPSGRYPLSTDPGLIHQLEAFRKVFLEKTAEGDKIAGQTRVDNAIRAIVYPDQPITLTPQEQNLVRSITSIPTVQNLGVSKLRSEVGAPKPDEHSGAKPGVTDPVPHAGNAKSEVPKTADASTAAAIAASDAAVAASGLPVHPSVPAPAPSSSAAAGTESKPLVQTALPTPQTQTTSSQYPTALPANAETEPHKFTPNMGGAPHVSAPASTASVLVSVPSSGPSAESTASATTLTAPTSIPASTERPSVEPFTPIPGSTPVPGSPAIQMGQQGKPAVPENPAVADTAAGEKEGHQG
jgi:hypothetical protein